jgi:tetratricopeptide (TPR) repeat protein
MSAFFQRGLILFNQNRYDLADREFRQALASDPDHAQAHAFLALCLAEREKHDEAQHEADEAVRLEPDSAFVHYARARVLCERKRFKEATEAVEEAIRLDPENADYRGQLAGILMELRRWNDGLKAAEAGLALDPEHIPCLNLRAMSLVQLGRKQEASRTLGSALSNDPEDSFTHANQGWALMHQGDYDQALQHFRESLRLDPGNEWARAGVIEALKAKHLIYRVVLRFFLWMSRQSRIAQWAVILGIAFGRPALAQVAKQVPVLAPVIVPILVLTFAFLLLTWIASPLFNLVLRLNPVGRMALSREQRIESTWIGAVFVLAVAGLVASIVTRSDAAIISMIYFGFLLFPLSATFTREAGRPRTIMALYTLGVGLLGLPMLSVGFRGENAGLTDLQTALKLWTFFLYGTILATWIPALLGLRNRE